MLTEKALATIAPFKSLTAIVKPYCPAAVGVPDKVPFVERFNPGGNGPMFSDHEYGGTPPDAARMTEYVTPTEPLFSDGAVVIVSGSAMTIVKDCAADCDGTAPSTTLAVNVKVPATNGVPLKTPAALRVMPGGRTPLTDHAYGVVPPFATIVCCGYGVPTIPGGNEDGTIVSAAAIRIVSDFVASCAGLLESVRRTVKSEIPAVVGVPLMTPPDDSARPAGNVPEALDHAYGVVPLTPAKVAEYATLTTPAGKGEVVVIEGGAALMVIESVCMAVLAALSVTRTVKLTGPAVVGVPLITPPEDRLSQGKGVPAARDQVYGVVPPVATNVCE
jgi:hypothetical protein